MTKLKKIRPNRQKYYRTMRKKHCLVLNKSFMPLSIVTFKDAIGHMLDGATALDPVSYQKYTLKFCFVIPDIIVLDNEHFVTKRKWSRKKIFLRDDYKCYYCGVNLTSRNKTIDHVMPQSKGGKDTFENTVACCTICNSRKGDKLLEELGWEVTLPKEPAHNILYAYPKMTVPEIWKPFIK
jgi:hypothetical protein